MTVFSISTASVTGTPGTETVGPTGRAASNTDASLVLGGGGKVVEARLIINGVEVPLNVRAPNALLGASPESAGNGGALGIERTFALEDGGTLRVAIASFDSGAASHDSAPRTSQEFGFSGATPDPFGIDGVERSFLALPCDWAWW